MSERGQPSKAWAGPHSGPEPVGAVRSPGLARVPVTDRRRVQGGGGLPKGPRRSDLLPLTRRRPLQVPAVCTGYVEPLLRARIRVLVPHDAGAQPPGQPRRPIRRRAELQSPGPLLAHRSALSRPPRVVLRVRSPRPVPGALPLPLPGREPARVSSAAAHGAMHGQDSRPRDRHQRLVPADRPRAGRGVPGERHRRPHGAGPGVASSFLAPAERPADQTPCGRLSGCDGATGRCGPRPRRWPIRSCTGSGGTTSASPSSVRATATTNWSR